MPASLPLQVLILEDNPLDAQLMLDELRQGGFDPVARLVASQAEYRAQLDPLLDVILADYHLPQFDAPAALQLLQERGLKIPFIVVSGTVGEEQAVAIIKQGASDYLLKDRLARLSHAVAQALEVRQQQQAQLQAEAALRYEQLLTEALMQTLPDALYFKDAQGHFIRVNPAQVAMLGASSPEQVLGKTDFDFFASEHAQRAFDDEQAVLQTGALLIDQEEKLTWPDRPPKWVSATKLPLVDQTGQIIGLFGVSRDIDQRKQAEIALRASEERFRGLFETMVEGVALHRLVVDEQGLAVDYTIVEANPAFSVQTGIPWDSAIGKRASEVYGTNPAPYLAVYADVVASGQPLHFEPYYGPLRKSFSIYVFPVGPDQFTTVFEDITARKQTEEELANYRKGLEQLVDQRTVELKRTQNRIEAIVNNTVEGIVLAHPERGIEEVNAAFLRLLSATPSAFIGQSIIALVQAEERDRLAQLIQAVIDDGVARSGQFQILRRDQTTFDAQINLNFMGAGDTLEAGVVCTFYDITEAKQAEKALQQALEAEKELNELKSRFVSMASHEFRTPMATILSATELLSRYRSRMDEEHIDQKLATVVGQVKYLTEIIDDVLNLSHLQSGRTEYNPVELDLDGLCQEVLEEFRSRTDVTQELRYSSVPSPLRVTVDKRLMRQVINNLVSNAVKYSPPDRPVEVDLADRAETVVLRVRDHGIGIPTADQKRLFEPFHRAVNVGMISGTGLGLVITKEAIELHGGTIVCESKEGHGTTFIVTLPQPRAGG